MDDWASRILGVAALIFSIGVALFVLGLFALGRGLGGPFGPILLVIGVGTMVLGLARAGIGVERIWNGQPRKKEDPRAVSDDGRAGTWIRYGRKGGQRFGSVRGCTRSRGSLGSSLDGDKLARFRGWGPTQVLDACSTTVAADRFARSREPIATEGGVWRLRTCVGSG